MSNYDSAGATSDAREMHVAYINAFAYARGAANSARADGFVEAMTLGAISVTRMEHESYVSRKWQSRLTRWKLTRFPKLKSLLLGSAVTEWLGSLEPLPDLIVVFGTDIRFLRPARRWANQRGLPIVNDVVDWYQTREGASLGEKLFIAINNFWSMPFESARCDGVVTVSRRLGAYYNRRHVRNLRVPALISGISFAPSSEKIPERSELRPLQIAYVGSPGKRDRATIDNIRLLARSPQAGLPKMTVHLVGLGSRESVAATFIQNVEIIGHGRVTRGEAMRLLGNSDFTVLQRPHYRRFAQAGFPSKVAESLLMGVPVLANLTSDLDDYLVDGVNGILLKDDSLDALQVGITLAAAWRAARKPDSRLIRERARASFTPEAHASRLRNFLEGTRMSTGHSS